MELKEILSISKLPGLYKMNATRGNGIIVTMLGDTKKKFISSRSHLFTPLENITIYTETDSVELAKVFEAIKANEKAIPEKKADDQAIREFFELVLPNYDKEKVYLNDIRKIIKWYAVLEKEGFIKEAKKEAPKKKKATTKKKDKADK